MSRSNKATAARVHRFSNMVALSLLGDSGETAYLTPEAAIALAMTLQAYAFDVNQCQFHESSSLLSGHTIGFTQGDCNVDRS